jgi:hypothetical protein
MNYIYKDVLLPYIAELGESDPATKYEMLELYREIDSGRFDAKALEREYKLLEKDREDLSELLDRVHEIHKTFDTLMKKMELK